MVFNNLELNERGAKTAYLTSGNSVGTSILNI